MLNVSFKMITKVLMNRISVVEDHVIFLTQTAFVRGRYNMEGVLIFLEALFSIHRKKKERFIV